MDGKVSNSSESPAAEGEIELKIARALKGNAEKDRAKLDKKNQLTVRERIALLTDAETFVEDGLLANCNAEDLPADGVVTG
jgi:acetyl-CoA carboxylase carboxyltransferase component